MCDYAQYSVEQRRRGLVSYNIITVSSYQPALMHWCIQSWIASCNKSCDNVIFWGWGLGYGRGGSGHWTQLCAQLAVPLTQLLCTPPLWSIIRLMISFKYYDWGREDWMMTVSTHSVSVPWHEAGDMIHDMTWHLVIYGHENMFVMGLISWLGGLRTSK